MTLCAKRPTRCQAEARIEHSVSAMSSGIKREPNVSRCARSRPTRKRHLSVGKHFCFGGNVRPRPYSSLGPLVGLERPRLGVVLPV